MHLLLVDPIHSEFWICTSTEAQNQQSFSEYDVLYLSCFCGSFEPSFITVGLVEFPSSSSSSLFELDCSFVQQIFCLLPIILFLTQRYNRYFHSHKGDPVQCKLIQRLYFHLHIDDPVVYCTL